MNSNGLLQFDAGAMITDSLEKNSPQSVVGAFYHIQV